jgi:thiol peroxidase
MARTCTLKGTPFALSGPQLKPGDKAPDATLRKDLVADVRLSEYAGKPRLISVVPSLDTSVCAAQTKRLFSELNSMPNVRFLTVSCDLPPAPKRFCKAEKIDPERVTTLSDHRELSFGQAYGTLIPDLRIECRAVFVVDPGGTIRYAEYVPEIGQEPNYDAALAALRGLH